MTERTRLFRAYVQKLNDAGPRRSRFFDIVGESLRATAGQTRPRRRAAAWAHLLETVELVVHPHELLAGSILGNWPLAEDLPSLDERRREARVHLEQYRADKVAGKLSEGRLNRPRFAVFGRDHYDACLPFPIMQQIIAEMHARYAADDVLTPFEIGRELEHLFVFRYESRAALNELPWTVVNHCDLNWGKLVRRGLGDLAAEIEQRLATAPADKREFYETARQSVRAVSAFITRYAHRLRDEAAALPVQATRAVELAERAALCDRVAEGAPATFREALQLVWLVFVAQNLAGSSALSFARLDQYLFPFYQRDVAAGDLTAEAAKELLSCLWLKVNEPKMRVVISVCLGGTTPQGESAANELTRLCLQVTREVAQPYPNVSARVSKASPDWLYDEILATIRSGTGHPMVLNDETWIPSFERHGYPPEAARDYYNMGCVEMMIQGRMAQWQGCVAANLTGLLLGLIRDSARRDSGNASAGPFETFDGFLATYQRRLRDQIATGADRARKQLEWQRGRLYDPFASVLIDDCLERGLDVYQGGARYPALRPGNSHGIGTIADSLAAVRRLVFDEKRLTLTELAETLAANFAGHEALRAELCTSLPCYGNDDPEVDDLAQLVFATYADAMEKLNDESIPGTFVVNMFSYTGHLCAGEVLGATPNGRLRGEPLSNALDPTQGRDRRGPTSLIRSVTHLDHSQVSGAAVFNLKLTPNLVKGAQGNANLKALLRTYLDRKGCQIQVSFVDPEALRAAQEHPDQHRNLIVRVGGYSEYFTQLDRHLQDEVIRRTSHG